LETEDGKAVSLFSDEDLARTYIEVGGLEGYKPTVLDGVEKAVSFLTALQNRGVTYVALDPKYGQGLRVMQRIEKAIEDARKTKSE
jgi:hypothetical protein